MSVPKDSRKPAEADYVLKARELLLYTMSRYCSMSEKIKRLVGDAMLDSAWIIYNNVTYANTIRVLSKDDYDERIKSLAKASRVARTFSPKIEIAQELIYNRLRELTHQVKNKDDNDIPQKVRAELKAFEKAYSINWEYWSNLVRDTIALVNGVARSDKKRFSSKF